MAIIVWNFCVKLLCARKGCN